MELFATSERPLVLGDVAAALGIPKSSAHMLIATLIAEGYLEDIGRGRYRLPAELSGPSGWIGGSVGAIARAAAPEMDRLRDTLQETVVLGAPTATNDVRIVTHRPSPLAIRFDITVAPQIPGWATAMGHAILSHLPEDEVRAYLERTPREPLTAKTITEAEEIIARLQRCRARGYSLNIDERIEGASGAAAAILDPTGRPRAALNVVTLTARFKPRQREIVQALLASSRSIQEAAFGGRTCPPNRPRKAAPKRAASGE